MRRLVRYVLTVFLVLIVAPVVETDDTLPPWNASKQSFEAALKSKSPKEKARAFEYLRRRSEPEALAVLMAGFRKVRAEGDKIRNKQESSERGYEKLMNKLYAAQRKFDQSERSARDVASFNKTERKLTKQIAEARAVQKALENEWTQNRALLDSATDAAASVLRAMDEPALADALSVLRQEWLHGRDPEGPMRWMDVLAPVGRSPITAELHAALANVEIPQASRVAALLALANRRDGVVLGKAAAMLKLPPADFLMVTAAVSSLESMHDKRSIVPLIEFLKRNDLGRLRDDAREALISLTGEKHGPYYEPWFKWWQDNEPTFRMPPDPCPMPTVIAEKKSKTFYGIHSFSDRVLYIVDVSGSMDWSPGKRGVPGGEKAKMVTLREELIGSVNSLDEGSNFNVIVFNHEVMSWSGRGVATATDTSKKKLARWIEAIVPTGLTNIHDALEAGFTLILRTTPRPDFDTIYFLTDGKPTAGKIIEPSAILEAVREWNAVAETRIHVIGIGRGEDVDEAFLQALAEIGGGKYIQRAE